jgi:hypothetical protein
MPAKLYQPKSLKSTKLAINMGVRVLQGSRASQGLPELGVGMPAING